MSVSLSEHLPLLAEAPEGIKKLRGLILELAVRGKLVQQDPSDEPASELLKRIAAERAQLMPEGKVRKVKLLSPINTDEMPFELPVGWVWVRNGTLFGLKKGKVPKDLSEEKKEFPYLDIEALDRGNIRRYTDDQKCPRTTEKDILVVCDGSRSGLVLNGRNGAIGSTLAVVETPFFIQSLVKLIFKQSYERLNSTMKGAAIPHLDTANLVLEVIGLPPLAEQHRIVAKVDELMALCDRMEAEQADAEAAHATLVRTLLGTLTQSRDAAELAANWQRLSQHFDTLFTTETSLDTLKQTVLQLAVMGKLVPQDPKDETASELLKRVATEKALLVAKGKIKKDKSLAVLETDGLYVLPANWQWTSLGSLVKLMDAGWSPACHETPSHDHETWGVLKTTSIQTLKFLEYENKELPANLEPRPECEVSVGDILITRAGPKNRVGISCLVEKTRQRLMISDKIIRFHLVDGGMYDKYVALCLNAGVTAEYLEKSKSGMAVSQMNISQDKLRLAPIPACSAMEQHRIVAKVDELMALCDSLKADLGESRARQARLATTLIESALQAA